MRRLIWGFAGRTYHIVGNLMSQLNNFFKLEMCPRDTHSSPLQKWRPFMNKLRAITPEGIGRYIDHYGTQDRHILWLNLLTKFYKFWSKCHSLDITSWKLSFFQEQRVITPDIIWIYRPLSNSRKTFCYLKFWASFIMLFGVVKKGVIFFTI